MSGGVDCPVGGQVGLLSSESDGRRLREAFLVLILYVVSMVAFALLHPIQEWPDAGVHISRSCLGDVSFPPRDLLAALGQDVCGVSFNENLSGEFKFFSDRSIHSDPHAVNPIWAYILLPVSCVAMLFGFILISGSRDRVGNHLIFAPPLAFYLANVNPEVFGHFFVIGAYFVMRTRPRLALLLTVVATAIDRSHVCSMFMLMLIYFFAAARTWVFVCVVGGVLLMYLVRMMGLLDILDLLALVFDSVSVLGITGKDILFNAEFGGRGYAALFASVAGLYGAMSYRPVLWFLYYALFFGLFFLGYALSDHRERRVFWLCATAVLSIMILLPPLSQARFYPILILSMWSMAVRGGRWFGIPALQLQILFFSWTMFTLVLANLNRIAES